MNEFEPKAIKKASHYLQDKIDFLKQTEVASSTENVYIIEDKKDSKFKRFVNSIFK